MAKEKNNHICLYCFLFFNFFVSNAQKNEIEFKKILIEADGGAVFDVYLITQEHQEYMHGDEFRPDQV